MRDFKTNVETLHCNVSTPRFIHLISNALCRKATQLVYALLPEAIKKGYATEASTHIMEYCFSDLGYQYLLASCNKPNLESQKVAQDRLNQKPSN